jgi:hypothetical protein
MGWVGGWRIAVAIAGQRGPAQQPPSCKHCGHERPAEIAHLLVPRAPQPVSARGGAGLQSTHGCTQQPPRKHQSRPDVKPARAWGVVVVQTLCETGLQLAKPGRKGLHASYLPSSHAEFANCPTEQPQEAFLVLCVDGVGSAAVGESLHKDRMHIRRSRRQNAQNEIHTLTQI